MTLPAIPTPRAELVRQGFDPRAIDRSLRSGRARAPYRSVILDGSVDLDHVRRCQAALATQDDRAAIGHESAAALLRLPWVPSAWSDPAAAVHVLVERDVQRRHRPGLRLHRARVPDGDVVLIDGVRCSTPARTLIDLARRPKASRLHVVQLADGALRRQRCTPEALEQAVAAATGLRNVARARSWLALSRPGVDSPRETELRLILTDGGVTDLVTDLRIHDHDGTVLARGDLGSYSLLLWGEYDGYEFHSERPAFRSDRVGDRWLERRGWHVMRFVDEDLRRPERTVREWRTAQAHAARRIAGMDPRRSPEVAAARRALGFD